MSSPPIALLVLDMQNGVFGRVGSDDLLEAVQRAIEAARHAQVKVLFVRTAFREGYPEVSGRNKAFAQIAGRGRAFLESSHETQLLREIAPVDGDVVVVKRRFGAFTGNDLTEVLRAQQIHELVHVGVSSAGAVLSTLRQAADLDFGLTVLSDACADPDPEVHRVLVEKVYPMQAQVLTAVDWAASLAVPTFATAPRPP